MYVPRLALSAPIQFLFSWIDAGAVWGRGTMLPWIHVICCLASNEPQSGQIGTSVEWMVLDSTHSSSSDPRMWAHNNLQELPWKNAGLISLLSVLQHCLLSPYIVSYCSVSLPFEYAWVSRASHTNRLHHVIVEFFKVCMGDCIELNGHVMITLASEPWIQWWSRICNYEDLLPLAWIVSSLEEDQL